MLPFLRETRKPFLLTHSSRQAGHTSSLLTVTKVGTSSFLLRRGVCSGPRTPRWDRQQNAGSPTAGVLLKTVTPRGSRIPAMNVPDNFECNKGPHLLP